MECVILAAGTGSRMGSLTESCPKAGLVFNGKCLIDYQLQALKSANITNINIVTGHQSNFFDNYEIKQIYNPLYEHVNMVTSLYCFLKQSKSNEDLVISYADIIYSTEVIKSLIASTEDKSVVVSADPNWLQLWNARMENVIEDAESFKFDENKSLFEIGGKLEVIEDAMSQYRGLIFVNKSKRQFLKEKIENDFLKKNKFGVYMTDLLQSIIDGGDEVLVDIFPGSWLEFDTQEDLKTYNKMFSKGELKNHFKGIK
jgi:L-glutamine-phosphate cytidylyltransferase